MNTEAHVMGHGSAYECSFIFYVSILLTLLHFPVYFLSTRNHIIFRQPCTDWVKYLIYFEKRIADNICDHIFEFHML